MMRVLNLALCMAFVVGSSAQAVQRKTSTTKQERFDMPSNDGFPPIVKPVTATDCLAVNLPNKPYFVEFRARTAASYGHTFVLYGKLGKAGFQKVSVAGLHPKGDSSVTYSLGHVVPVEAETGASWGDMDEQYMTARYCVRLDEAEYGRVVSYIHTLQAIKKTWLATGYNCNTFGSDIARFMGLKAPMSSIILPENLINTIRDMNNGRKELTAIHNDYENAPQPSIDHP